MRIVFHVFANGSRNGPIDGDSVRTGGAAVSGTDTSTVVLAERLAALGHDVVVASERPPPSSRNVVRGVRYTDIAFSDLEQAERVADVFVNTLWFDRYEEDLPITVTKAVVQWCHMQYIYGVDEVHRYCASRSLRMGVVSLSEWAFEKISPVLATMRERCDVPATIVHNAMPEDMYVDLSVHSQVPRSVAFHATWSRGGAVALRAIEQLNNIDVDADAGWKIHACSYLSHGHHSPHVVSHGPLDKGRLYAMLASCEYFVYPCIDSISLDVHMDTFSCVVAEALAMGVTVVAYRLGALEELYAPCIEFVDFPEGADVGAIAKMPLIKDAAIAANHIGFVRKLQELDAEGPETKARRRARNASFARAKFSADGSAARFSDFLGALVRPKAEVAKT